MAKWWDFAKYPEMVTLWPAIEAGIEILEKYYNKTKNSTAHIVSMCRFIYYHIWAGFKFNLDLNPCIKDEYFKVAWTETGQTQARTVMDMVVCIETTFYFYNSLILAALTVW